MACLQGQSAKALTHDNLFHSMLGLSQVKTGLAKPDLDLFAACSGSR
jgi:lipid A ethanolaminephosphotransferase